mmetsp:Transcript_25797/g.65005  ORF Transcript_25797/g.65005 Transcript_25797/m.65005 type:complete len:212 (-) Transcript_25797:45-680(-)
MRHWKCSGVSFLRKIGLLAEARMRSACGSNAASGAWPTSKTHSGSLLPKVAAFRTFLTSSTSVFSSNSSTISAPSGNVVWIFFLPSDFMHNLCGSPGFLGSCGCCCCWCCCAAAASSAALAPHISSWLAKRSMSALPVVGPTIFSRSSKPAGSNVSPPPRPAARLEALARPLPALVPTRVAGAKGAGEAVAEEPGLLAPSSSESSMESNFE